MKIQVIYSSLSGSTKRLAQGIFDGLVTEDKSIHDLAEGVPELTGDIILLGYWVDRAGPNEEMKKLMEGMEGKTVGVFCTLAYFVDSTHGMDSIKNGIALVKDKNTVLGSYVCNGALGADLIEKFRQGGAGPHSASPEKELRWALMKDHPTSAEIALASERFNERVTLYGQFQEGGFPYQSLT